MVGEGESVELGLRVWLGEGVRVWWGKGLRVWL